MFIPENSNAPAGFQTKKLVLAPLKTAHVEIDFEAVVSSRELLRIWSQSDWPSDDFTLADNREDLARHESEHNDSEAFTYTIMSPDGTECLGCVYIEPLPEKFDDMFEGKSASMTRFWVRQSELANDLDQMLLTYLRKWFEHEWPFEHTLFVTATEDQRQTELFVQSGLVARPDIELDHRTGAWAVYAPVSPVG